MRQTELTDSTVTVHLGSRQSAAVTSQGELLSDTSKNRKDQTKNGIVTALSAEQQFDQRATAAETVSSHLLMHSAAQYLASHGAVAVCVCCVEHIIYILCLDWIVVYSQSG